MGSCASNPAAATRTATADRKAPVRHRSPKAARLLWKSPSGTESLYTVDDRVPTPTEFPDTATATFNSAYELEFVQSPATPQQLATTDWTAPSSYAPNSRSQSLISHTQAGEGSFESIDYMLEAPETPLPVKDNGPRATSNTGDPIPTRRRTDAVTTTEC